MKTTRVYLGGPINGCTDDEAHGWRQKFVEKLQAPHFECIDPMRRDYRGREDECYQEIIDGDLADIDVSDVVVLYKWQISEGTAQEGFYAYRDAPNQPKVITIIPEGARVSPWARGHTHVLVNSCEEAIEEIQLWGGY
jgi:hypothetical protein